jgi:hypothetical protein
LPQRNSLEASRTSELVGGAAGAQPPGVIRRTNVCAHRQVVPGVSGVVHQRHRGSQSGGADGSRALGLPAEDDAVQPRAREDGGRGRTASQPGEEQGGARAGARTAHPRQSRRGKSRARGHARAGAAGAQDRFADRLAGAAGNRRGVSGQPAAGQGRAAGVPGQSAAPGETALTSADQGSAGRGRHGDFQRRLQGRRPRRHHEDRRGDPAEALRGLGGQSARREGHGRHRRDPGKRGRAQGARAAGARGVPGESGIQHAAPGQTAAAPAIKEMGPDR